MSLYLFQVPIKTHLKEIIFIDIEFSYSPIVCLFCYHSNWSSRGSYFLIKCSDQLVLNIHIFLPKKEVDLCVVSRFSIDFRMATVLDLHYCSLYGLCNLFFCISFHVLHSLFISYFSVAVIKYCGHINLYKEFILPSGYWVHYNDRKIWQQAVGMAIGTEI